MKRALIVLALALAALGAWAFLAADGYTPRPLPEARPSSAFTSTVMVPALETSLPAGKSVIFDRPFLLVMKTRGAARPYLAVWVDNPEILDPR